MPSEMASFHVSSVPFLPVERCSPWLTSFARNADSNKFTRHYFHYFDDVGYVFSVSIVMYSLVCFVRQGYHEASCHCLRSHLICFRVGFVFVHIAHVMCTRRLVSSLLVP